MAEITATETFDEEELDPDTVEELEPLLEWLNTNMQNIVSALRGELGDKNSRSQTVTVKTTSEIRNSVSVVGEVSNVSLSRIDSQIESPVYITGFNWWPTADGFDYVARFSGDKKDRNINLRVDFNV
jgi:hypothetical protein